MKWFGKKEPGSKAADNTVSRAPMRLALDCNTVAALPVARFMDKEEPFAAVFDESRLASWCISAYPLKQQHVPIIKAAVMGCQFLSYLELLEDRYGTETAAIIKA